MPSDKQVPRMTPIFGAKRPAKSASYVNSLVLDWSNILHRAAAVSTSGSVLGTIAKMLLTYRRRFSGWSLVVALDGERGTYERKALCPSYKANRGERTDDYAFVEKLSADLLSCLDCTVIETIDGEADDVIATYVSQVQGRRVVIVSEDRDMWQLITNSVTVWARHGTEVTPEYCQVRLGVPPRQVPVLKALLGDKSDNIPRAIPRVKTEALTRLARELHSLDDVATTLPRIDGLTSKDLAKITAHWETVEQNYKVVSLRRDLRLRHKTHRGRPQELDALLQRNHVYWLTSEDIHLIATGSHQ